MHSESLSECFPSISPSPLPSSSKLLVLWRHRGMCVLRSAEDSCKLPNCSEILAQTSRHPLCCILPSESLTFCAGRAAPELQMPAFEVPVPRSEVEFDAEKSPRLKRVCCPRLEDLEV